jgi:hypothetical protein
MTSPAQVASQLPSSTPSAPKDRCSTVLIVHVELDWNSTAQNASGVFVNIILRMILLPGSLHELRPDPTCGEDKWLRKPM